MNTKGIELAPLGRSLLVGIAITLASPFLSMYTVTKMEQLSDVRFGFPFKFVSQQTWLTPFEKDLPIKVHIGLPQEYPTKIIFGNFLLSLITITAVVFLVNIFWIEFRNNGFKANNN